MTTYFVHNYEGILVGWIEAVDQSSAQIIVDELYDSNVTISTLPDGDWYIRHEVPSETPELAFAA